MTMEPTQGRTGGGNRPSAAKRYGPLIVIVAIVAIIAIVVAVTSGGGDDDKADVSTGTGGGSSASANGIPKQPWPIFTEANKDSIDWGPNCNTETGTVKIPYNYASPCAKPFTG